MKTFVIAINDILLYLALLTLALFCLVVGGTSDWLKAGGIFCIGLVIWCVLCGFWFVLSGIHEQLVELNRKSK